MRLSFGSIVIGVAATWLVVAYVVQPFRRKKAHTDRIIEAWIAVTQAELAPSTPDTSEPLADTVHRCPHCGRRVEDDHRFCPGCGTELSLDAPE
jgi:rubrerythrin